ncbi:MAG: dodecin domain-containing protein [Deltaproteobacteria bacterium]|nr:dodecin domain-containing protein [Deltaproteobacteria bacterium]
MAIAKVTEFSASSNTSFEDAIEKGIARASKTLKNIRGAWISEQKIIIDGGNIKEYRVSMKLSFELEE